MDFFDGAGSGLIAGAFDLAGGLLGRKKASGPSAWDLYHYQDQLNKNQIQWRVEDAKKAGLHPLAALGVSGMSMSAPSVVGDTGSDSSWLGNLGQSVARGIQVGMSAKDRAEQREFQRAQNAIDLEGKQVGLETQKAQLDQIHLQNQLAKQELVRHAQQVPVPNVGEPAKLLAGQGDAPYTFQFSPLADLRAPFGNKADIGLLADYHKREGLKPSAIAVQNLNGTIMTVPNEDAVGDIDILADPFKAMGWYWANKINPKNLPFLERVFVEPLRETAKFMKHYKLYPSVLDSMAAYGAMARYLYNRKRSPRGR